MEIGVIGLGKMGYGLACNLKDNGYTVYGYDINSSEVAKAADYGIGAYSELSEFLKSFENQKIIFLMTPSGVIVDETIEKILPELKRGDIIIDAGNSNFNDSIRRYKSLKEKGIDFLDCGTSGGPRGARHGACTMIGGDFEVYKSLETVFEKISVEGGSLYTGEAGSGHYVKMIHNGIEYGMMQAIAEGYELLYKSGYDLDLEKISKLWNNGSVIRSWLVELAGSALSKNPDMQGLQGIVHASGEGKWTVETALDLEVPAPVIALSLMMRNRSLESDTFAGKLLASLRNEFGGHDIVE